MKHTDRTDTEAENEVREARDVTVHLLNAAVMPHPGFYDMQEIDSTAFAELVQEANELGQLKHYIGYESTLAFVQHLTAIDLGGRNMNKTEMKDGDSFLVIRLVYRPTQEQRRTDNPQLEDFEFFKGIYSKA
ncbi:DUF1874 domain-containing protein [Candidatus Poribacteria bacterium]|nr:DUF1874 domain-containing protein [Candidatus Poribacteria bacterium]MYB66011.1 DUF1874 domain-containing protein [Candidatus Poribacteria bacterium]